METLLSNRELEYKQLKKRRKIEFTQSRKAQSSCLTDPLSGEHSQTFSKKVQPIKNQQLGLFSPLIVEHNLHWKKIYRVGPGFYNEGNTCFLNSTLQCLLYQAPFAQILLTESEDILSRLQKHDNKLKSIIELFTILVREVWQNLQRGPSISPKGLVTSIRRVGKQFKPFRQEDAHEYLRQLIDTMHEEILKSHGLKLSDGKITETSMIARVFGGSLCNILTCPQCKYQSKTSNHFQDLSLDVNKQGITSVDATLRSFMQIEYLTQGNEWKCDKCKQKVKASKQMIITEAPPVLVLHLKRFSFGNMFAKITKHIQFAPNLLLPEHNNNSESSTPISYELTGVVVHHGFSTHSGHYVAFVKAPNGQWYEMDDQQVSTVSLKTVLQSQAYILFYGKTPPPPLATTTTTVVPTSANIKTITKTSLAAPTVVPNNDSASNLKAHQSAIRSSTNNNIVTPPAAKPQLTIQRTILAGVPLCSTFVDATNSDGDDSDNEIPSKTDNGTYQSLSNPFGAAPPTTLRLKSRPFFVLHFPMRYEIIFYSMTFHVVTLYLPFLQF